MKSMAARLAALAAVIGLITVLAGCEHKELCYDHKSISATLEVRFVWDNATDADPNTMVVNFFSLDGRHVACREFAGRDGGMIKIESGEYMILFHNGGMDAVKEAVDDYDVYALKTVDETLLGPMARNLEAPPRPSASAGEPVRSPAEMVWAGQHEYVRIESGKNGQIIELHPQEVTSRYTVEVVNVKNLTDNIDLSAAISGLSEGMNISRCKAAGMPVTVPFAVSRKDATSFGATFLTFGHCPDDNTVKHILSIYTSAQKYFNIDVTGQVHNAPDERNVYIRVEGLVLPDDKDGMSPAINGWDEEENIEIKM